jgi:hypothetical protein
MVGWEGKGKGLLQILWERGWIDESMIKWFPGHPKYLNKYELLN